MNISNRMLINISKQIDTGRAVIGLATANYYLENDCLLRGILSQKAGYKFKKSKALTARIIAGEKPTHKEIMDAALKENSNRLVINQKLIVPSNFNLQIARARKTRRP